jgi:hypothetical protein
MPCYICNQAVDEPRLDPRDMKTMPCSTCEHVIQDCIDSYPKDKDDEKFFLDSEDVVVYLDTTLDDFEEFRERGPSIRDY